MMRPSAASARSHDEPYANIGGRAAHAAAVARRAMRDHERHDCAACGAVTPDRPLVAAAREQRDPDRSGVRLPLPRLMARC